MNEKKVMIISGTSKGIGRYLRNYYLEKGFEVIGCSRNQSNEEISQNYHHFQLDVSDEKKVKDMFSFIRKKFGKLDYLVNNAGTGSMNHSLLMPIKTAQRILNTNLIGTFLLSREAAKIMKKNSFGRIINFASFAIPFKLEGEAVYAASKAGIISLTEIMGREFSEYGITVNVVAPPAVKTDLIKGVPEEKMEKLLKRQAIHRFGKPEEVAKVIDFFIDDDNDMITGQSIYMGGV